MRYMGTLYFSRFSILPTPHHLFPTAIDLPMSFSLAEVLSNQTSTLPTATTDIIGILDCLGHLHLTRMLCDWQAAA